MTPTIYWITAAEPRRVAIVARPRGGEWLDEEIVGLRREGVDVLVSLLTSNETAELALQDEERLCTTNRIQFFSLPIEDRSVPDESEVIRVLESVMSQVTSGKSVGFHCRAGIGRSSILATLVLARLGWTPEEAFRMISEARGCEVPDTSEQKQWTRKFARRFSPPTRS
jgi:protein-tyrosine phosphatase